MSRPAASQHLHLTLRAAGGTLTHRIATAVIEVIARDEIRVGEAVPSTRSLAAQLSVPRSAVVAAYEELAAYGYLLAKPGAATWVAPGAGDAARQEAHPNGRSGERPALSLGGSFGSQRDAIMFYQPLAAVISSS